MRDNVVLKQIGDHGLRPYMEEWLRLNGYVSDRSATILAKEAKRLMREGSFLRVQPRNPYLVMVMVLISGNTSLLDIMDVELKRTNVQPVLKANDDYIWARVFMIAAPVRTQAKACAVYTCIDHFNDMPELSAPQGRSPPFATRVFAHLPLCDEKHTKFSRSTTVVPYCQQLRGALLFSIKKNLDFHGCAKMSVLQNNLANCIMLDY